MIRLTKQAHGRVAGKIAINDELITYLIYDMTVSAVSTKSLLIPITVPFPSTICFDESAIKG
jgi:hypothetical protein